MLLTYNFTWEICARFTGVAVVLGLGASWVTLGSLNMIVPKCSGMAQLEHCAD